MKVQVNGAVIKELRVKHSYTQERLAEIVGERRRSLTFEFLSRRIAA
jgi:DNA-binding XRE family transcriptional regulator